jgi:MYXO-CTERM domain-containing protein
VRIGFTMNIPENFSGPAQWQLDNVEFAAIPEPGSIQMAAMGIAALGALAAARRKKVW